MLIMDIIQWVSQRRLWSQHGYYYSNPLLL